MTGPTSTTGVTNLATLPPPSDLAQACDWAVAHMAWINDTSEPDHKWSDERITEEVARFDAVLRRVADEPSADVAVIAAKARVLLVEYRDAAARPANEAERALLTLLQEVIALCA